jgi:hypothetical protein
VPVDAVALSGPAAPPFPAAPSDTAAPSDPATLTDTAAVSGTATFSGSTVSGQPAAPGGRDDDVFPPFAAWPRKHPAKPVLASRANLPGRENGRGRPGTAWWRNRLLHRKGGEQG